MRGASEVAVAWPYETYWPVMRLAELVLPVLLVLVLPLLRVLPGVAWWNIWPIALFGMPAPEKTFRDLNSFFFPPPSLQPNTTPK